MDPNGNPFDPNRNQQGVLWYFFRIPGPPVDVNAILWLLLFPLLIIWFVIADLITGWNKWRIGGCILGLAIAIGAGVTFMVLDLRAEFASVGTTGQAEVPFVDVIEVVAQVGTGVFVIFLIPRTVLAIVVLFALKWAWGTLISPLLEQTA